ncbi:MAG: response regulator transcription factor [Odoribacter sp.]|nr:response regulator transcription factor [Odoribacter sp.]
MKTGLEEAGYIISLAYDAKMGLRLLKSSQFDLIISDVILPNMNGFEFCNEVRKTLPDIPILMLTALGTIDDKLEGFDAGADDYMTKPFDFRELDARIKVLLKRKSADVKEAKSILQYADLKMDLKQKTVERGGIALKLTPKEFNLLEYLMQNPERVLSRVEIAEKVWNTHFDTGTNFIDVYINYLRKKVDKDFKNRLIHTKAGMGFILKQEE